MILISGNEFRHVLPENYEAARKKMTDAVTRGIDRCPHSVLLIDEIDLMPPDLMSVLSPILQQMPFEGRRTARLFNVWTSNLGEAVVSQTDGDTYITELLPLIWPSLGAMWTGVNIKSVASTAY
jgi:hypothetical protein